MTEKLPQKSQEGQGKENTQMTRGRYGLYLDDEKGDKFYSRSLQMGHLFGIFPHTKVLIGSCKD